MSKFEIGDIIKGLPGSNYSITDEKMTKAVVKEAMENEMVIVIKEHENGHTGKFTVRQEFFEKIGHLKPFNAKKFRDALKAGTEQEYLRGADLSYADLRGADLRDADLRGADLSYADLRGADLRDADLSGADLSYADLRDADLRDVVLSGAVLSGAVLSCADLRGADLRDAVLSGAVLSGADLRDAVLSGAKGLIDAINYMEANFEKTEEGYIVYKSFGAYNTAPDTWKIEPGSIIEEVVNPNRTDVCGCGINVAPLEWVRRDNDEEPYKLLIRFEWLAGVVVPYNTDGKIRCSRAQIIGSAEE